MWVGFKIKLMDTLNQEQREKAKQLYEKIDGAPPKKVLEYC